MKTLLRCAFAVALLACGAVSAQEVFSFDAIAVPAPIVPGGRLEPRQLLVMQASLGTRPSFVLSVSVTFADAKTETFTCEFVRRGTAAAAPEPLYGLVTARGNSAITGVKAFLDLGPQVTPKAVGALSSSTRTRNVPVPLESGIVIRAGDNFARHFRGKNPPAALQLPLYEIAKLVAAKEAFAQLPPLEVPENDDPSEL